MLDWAKISSSVEQALTLDGSALTSFLNTVADTQEENHIKRLLRQAQKGTGFLATSASEDVISDTFLAIGTMIGTWEILTHLGRGGMGDVYKARRADGLYEQDVALKVMQGITQSRASLFEVERRRLALMNHSGIARIIDGGASEDGRLYMVMEYVDGLSISDYLAQHQLDIKSKLKLFLSVCAAVEHAHGQLVLHKDIKAENVLVDALGNTRLIDFGIASEVDEQDNTSAAFSLATAAPEQLKGQTVSVQTDVFALGILLHELLIGKRPSRTSDGGMQADKLTIGDLDLSAIIVKALALEPSERYRAVSSLSDDVRAVLRNNPVSARQGGWTYRVSKFLQRYPIASSFAFIALLSLGGGLAASINFANEAKIEAGRAKTALAESEASLARARFFLERSDLFHSTQSAYADTLQSLFGAQADVDKQTRVLKERWEQANEMRGEDPNNAAYLTYAIGRHFLFRNDYKTAIDIFEPLVIEEYGPAALVGFARQLLAIAYSSVGRESDSLVLLRKSEQWLSQSFDAGTPDHIAAATQIATLTEERDDILKAEALLIEGLAGDVQDPIKMYFWNQTSKMRQMMGDFDGAHEAVKEVVKFIESKPLMERSGSDTGFLNLADYELWHTQNLKRAKELADMVIATGIETKGESREIGIAYSILAQHSMLSDNYEQALDYAQQAYELIEKYSGEQSTPAIKVNILRAETYASLQDIQAKSILQGVYQALDGSKRSTRLVERVKLADIFITLQLEGEQRAIDKYTELSLEQSVIAKNIELSYLYKRLSKLGVQGSKL